MSYHVIQQYICCFGSAFGLNQRRRKKKIKWRKTKQNKKNPGVSSENPAPAQVGLVLSPSTISGEVWSVTTQGSKRLNSFRQLEAQYTGSRFSHMFLGIGAGRSVTPLRWVCPFYPSLWRAGGEPRYWRPSVRMVGGHPQRRAGRDTCGREEGVRSSCQTKKCCSKHIYCLNSQT